MVRGSAELVVNGKGDRDGHRQCDKRGRCAGQLDGMGFAEGIHLGRDQRRALAMRNPCGNDVEFADAAVAASGDSSAGVVMPYWPTLKFKLRSDYFLRQRPECPA